MQRIFSFFLSATLKLNDDDDDDDDITIQIRTDRSFVRFLHCHSYFVFCRSRDFISSTNQQTKNMSFNTRSIIVFSISILALSFVFSSNVQEKMASLLQFGKSLFSARQTNVNNPSATPSFFERSLTNIQGQPLNMDDLRGKVLLLVNTASQCGYTPQLHTLQELHDKYKDRGFSVVVRRVFFFILRSIFDEKSRCFFRVFHVTISVNKNPVMNLKFVRYTKVNSKRHFL